MDYKNFSRLPCVIHENIHEYWVIGKSFDNEPKGIEPAVRRCSSK